MYTYHYQNLLTVVTDLMIYLQAIAEELVVEELVDDQDLAEDDEEVGGLAGVEQHRIAVILVVEMLLGFIEIIIDCLRLCTLQII